MNFLFDDSPSGTHKSDKEPYKKPHKKSYGKTSHKKGKNTSPQNHDPNAPKIKVPRKISERYLYNSGLAYLQRFTSSSNNFRKVMMRKIDRSCKHHTDQVREECQELLELTVEKFEKAGLLNDEEYLRGMVISLRRRGLSSRQIDMRLRMKGLEQENIKQELQEHDLSTYDTEYNGDIYAAIIFARKKKIGPYDKVKKYEPQKALAMMGRAGYDYGTAKKVLEMSEDDLEEYQNNLY